MEGKFNLSLQRAKQAAVADQSKFTFIVGTDMKEYVCCVFQACLISQKVCEIISSDPTCMSLRVAENEDCNEFALIESLWNGEEIHINKENANKLRKLFYELGNDEMGNLMMDFELSSEKISAENAISRMHLKSKMELKNDDEIEFIAANLFRFSVHDLKSLKVSELEMILTHKSLKLENESALLDVVFGLMEVDRGYSVLLNYIKFEFLDFEHAESFFTAIYPEFVSSIVWKSVTDFALESIKRRTHPECSRYRVEKKQIQYVSNPVDGIFSYLRRECGGNACEKGVIGITASLERGTNSAYIQSVIDYGSDNVTWWTQSTSIPNQWIQFDFQRSACSLTSYTIKSGGTNKPKLRVIECSNDGVSWTIVDSRNTSDICSNFSTKHFSCSQPSSEYFRYIRMRLTGNNSSNHLELRLCEIEFFGSLRLC